ncbi:Rap guanine nucleotide exchange factor 4 [Hypsibius exemplaris]|uniref:Rap guanine nucleotide exchange factor 4 n=1 Tax=Hypsibius exemplaris TaxID=2072580 RepID=A0A1W0WIZ7_HYPEX|nr:Rap guanine nucleotide exchange factor 4 [Hypsibius exemplaris]
MKDTRFAGLTPPPNAATQGTSMQFMALGTSDWLSKLDRRPADRSQEDIAAIFNALQSQHPLQKLHPSLLRHLSHYGLYEAVEKNITLFREGENTRNWYAVVEGRLRVIRQGQNFVVGKGAVFEEITGYDGIRKLTIVTKEPCQLIRLEKKHMRLFCKSYPYQLKDVAATTVLELDQIERPSDTDGDLDILAPPRITVNHLDQNNHDGDASHPNSAGYDNGQDGNDLLLLEGEQLKPRTPPLTDSQAALLLTSVIDTYPEFVHSQLGRKHCITAENLMTYITDVTQSQSTRETMGICQVLLEDAVIKPLDRKTEFVDFQTTPSFVYFFPSGVTPLDAIDEDDLQSLLDDLIRHGSDALLRMTLRKPPNLRSNDEIDFIYSELMHIKALAHLSTTIKRQLAGCILLESHNVGGTVLFNQGDEGTSWFIILKGSVNVVIYGKGIVCSLHEGDDFGKLALVNDAPRAASIILREPCHLLRVDKDDFNRILKDVEANTVRLKELGMDVLILEKIQQPFSKEQRGDKNAKSYRYSVMAGTAEKVLEYILDSRLDEANQHLQDTLLEDYLLTYIFFISTELLCQNLLMYYNSRARPSAGGEAAKNRMLLNRRHVVAFVMCWYEIDAEIMFQKAGVREFLKTLSDSVYADSSQYDLKTEVNTMESLTQACDGYYEEMAAAKLTVSSDSSKSEDLGRPIRPSDETIVKVFSGTVDPTYTAVRVSAETRAEVILKLATKKQPSSESGFVLVEIKSNGEYKLFKDEEMSVESNISVNGRLFCCTKDQLAHLNPLPEQQGPNEPSGKILETISSRELAYHSTMYDWSLFRNVHESELIHYVLGRQTGITNNLDRLVTRHSQISWWVATEICLTSSQGKRVHLIKKFIKAAQHCKEFKNLFGYMAITMGLANTAVTRLSQTFEKLPAKFKKLLKEFESFNEPSRNHRASRYLFSTINKAPVIPFIPLITKDITFAHEGNKTLLDDHLVNFDKMHMVADILRIVRFCKSEEMDLPIPPMEKPHEYNMAAYFRGLRVIDNQRRLMQLSFKKEQKKYQ